MKIRKFEERDAEECYNIILNCIKARKNLSDKSKRKILSEARPKKLIEKSKKRIYFVCCNNNKVIGIGGLNKDEVVKMYVHPKFQNKGIGTFILKRIEKEAKKRKIKKLALYTYPKALNFYIKNGFVIIKRFNREMNSVYMSKSL